MALAWAWVQRETCPVTMRFRRPVSQSVSPSAKRQRPRRMNSHEVRQLDGQSSFGEFGGRQGSTADGASIQELRFREPLYPLYRVETASDGEVQSSKRSRAYSITSRVDASSTLVWSIYKYFKV